MREIALIFGTQTILPILQFLYKKTFFLTQKKLENSAGGNNFRISNDT
jgi:hypothetical protein